MLKNKLSKVLIEEVTECGELIEAEYFNERFGLCDRAKIRNLRLKAKRRLDALEAQGHNIHGIASYDDDFAYAIQMI